MSRPNFTPTAQQRDLVKAMIGYGNTEFEIATLIRNPETGKPIDAKTLRKHFKAEIATAAAKVEGWLEPRSRRSRLLDRVKRRIRRLAHEQDARIARMERQHQATVAHLREQMGAEAEHRKRTQRRMTELERTVRGDPGLARVPKSTRRQPLGVDNA